MKKIQRWDASLLGYITTICLVVGGSIPSLQAIQTDPKTFFKDLFQRSVLEENSEDFEEYDFGKAVFEYPLSKKLDAEISNRWDSKAYESFVGEHAGGKSIQALNKTEGFQMMTLYVQSFNDLDKELKAWLHFYTGPGAQVPFATLKEKFKDLSTQIRNDFLPNYLVIILSTAGGPEQQPQTKAEWNVWMDFLSRSYDCATNKTEKLAVQKAAMLGTMSSIKILGDKSVSKSIWDWSSRLDVAGMGRVGKMYRLLFAMTSGQFKEGANLAEQFGLKSFQLFFLVIDQQKEESYRLMKDLQSESGLNPVERKMVDFLTPFICVISRKVDEGQTFLNQQYARQDLTKKEREYLDVMQRSINSLRAEKR